MSETKFPLHEEKLSFELPKTDAPREKILALGKKITDRVPAKLHGVTGEDPEYWGLAGLVTDEMADVALKMGVRKPKTLQQMVKLTGMEEKKLEQLLEEMAYIGLVEYHWENLDGKNPNHEKRYVLCRVEDAGMSGEKHRYCTVFKEGSRSTLLRKLCHLAAAATCIIYAFRFTPEGWKGGLLTAALCLVAIFILYNMLKASASSVRTLERLKAKIAGLEGVKR